MPKERRDIPAPPKRPINTNVLLAPYRNELWGFGVVKCSDCRGTGVTPFHIHHLRLCNCVLRGVARYVLGMVNRIRWSASSLSMWSMADPRSYYILCDYCADVEIMIAKLPQRRIEALSNPTGKTLPTGVYNQRYQALAALGAEALRRGLYPPSVYFAKGNNPCPYPPPKKSIKKSTPPLPVPQLRTPSPA